MSTTRRGLLLGSGALALGACAGRFESGPTDSSAPGRTSQSPVPPASNAPTPSLETPRTTAPAVTAPGSSSSPVGTPFAHGSLVLFQGDSITDAGRNRLNSHPNHPDGMGHGYVSMVARRLLLRDASLKVRNVGISGDTVPRLNARWTRDVIDLEPDVLSILVGVNDFLGAALWKGRGTAATFHRGYDQLLTTTRRALPRTRLVICEPFLFAVPGTRVTTSMPPQFAHYRKAVRALAVRHRARLVTFQAAFDAHSGVSGKHWAVDGVHPTPAGADLMAEEWMKTIVG